MQSSTQGRSGDAGGIALLAAALGKSKAAKSAFLVLHSLTDSSVVSSEQANSNGSLLARMQSLRHCSALLHQCSITNDDAHPNDKNARLCMNALLLVHHVLQVCALQAHLLASCSIFHLQHPAYALCLIYTRARISVTSAPWP